MNNTKLQVTKEHSTATKKAFQLKVLQLLFNTYNKTELLKKSKIYVFFFFVYLIKGIQTKSNVFKLFVYIVQ